MDVALDPQVTATAEFDRSIITMLAFSRERGAGGSVGIADADRAVLLLPGPAPAPLDRRNDLNLMLRHRTTPSDCTRTCSLQPNSARRPSPEGYVSYPAALKYLLHPATEKKLHADKRASTPGDRPSP